MTLAELKCLAGIDQLAQGSTQTPLAGSNISLTGTEKRRIEKEHNIEPGTEAWFQLWFSLPKLTGEKPIK